MTPIAPASFLRYYVSELHRRQTCFTALSAETGRLIRKYETYRAVQRETGAVSEILPRILLMIDEYQSLFEGNTETAALLSELVRKGRTYGVHLIMASQRGVSESARNTFTAELKDHFSTTSRFFRCPPAAARPPFQRPRGRYRARKHRHCGCRAAENRPRTFKRRSGPNRARHRLRAMLLRRG